MISRIIKCIVGFCIICIIQFLCNWVIKILHFAVPSPIMGLIIFAFLLQTEIIKKEWVKDICEILLKNMPLLFVPLFVGIIVYYGIIEKNLIPILINVILTATFTILITALLVENIIKYVRLRKIRKMHND